MSEDKPLRPPYQHIWNLLKRGKVIPFLGSGASVDARPHPPSADELARDLANEAEFPAGESRDLAKVAEYWNLIIGRAPLREKLHDIFCQEYAPAAVHRLLAGLPGPMLIVTTNYDTLIEDALRRGGHEFDLVVHSTTADSRIEQDLLWWRHGQSQPASVSEKVLGAELKPEDRTVVYKIHGTVNRSDDEYERYVITENDYVEMLARMTPQKHVLAPFADAFASRPFLFLGYGLRDWNLRVILNRIQKHRERMGKSSKGAIESWAIQSAPSALETRFWQAHHINIFDIRLDAFCKELEAYDGGSRQFAAGGGGFWAAPQQPATP